jgi:hypothetical protein
MDILYKPHFYAHIISSIAMVVALALLIMNYRKIIKMDALELIKIFTLIAIAVASNGQSHTTLEKEYGYDPVSAIFK